MIEVKVGNSLKVIGEFTLIHKDGTKEIINGKRSFCRCGRSRSQPFCDNTHRERLEKEKIEDEEAPF
jgi:CDGSH-type Zn-finger protein|tara:strand:- start:59 stop:259 length:201 start_codon:yes stop_codon:yes gene_type:complete